MLARLLFQELSYQALVTQYEPGCCPTIHPCEAAGFSKSFPTRAEASSSRHSMSKVDLPHIVHKTIKFVKELNNNLYLRVI